jgi:lysyl-tRNA synthetase class I
MQTLTAAQKRKRKSNLCKLLGGGLLLFSFIVQNYSYDIWNTRLEDFTNANRDYAAMHRSSMLYQNLYFNVKIPDTTFSSQVKTALIRNAAEKDAVGRLILLEADNVQKAHSKDLYERIKADIENVKDYASFLVYLQKAKEIEQFDLREEDEQIHRDRDLKEKCRNVFLLSYVIGSIVLLAGFRYE